MTKIKLNVFRKELEHKQAELESGIRNREALAIQTSSDDLDRIQFASERDSAMGNLARNSSRLREVQSALRRIDQGSFGTCVDCDQEINPKRLAAVPWASTCVVCQEAIDRGLRTPQEDFDAALLTTAS